MDNLIQAIPHVRDSVCAVMRIRQTRVEKVKKNKTKPAQFQLAFVGTAFGIVQDKYVLTAFHVLNNGKARDIRDKFYLFTVPQNGPQAFCFPVTGFPLEDPIFDLAILEFGPPSAPNQTIQALKVHLSPKPDGSRVFTYGFPAPVIKGAKIDPNGNFLGEGNFFIKAHVNEGIIAAQFDIDGGPMYEFNVGWYNGESGGPVLLQDPIGVLAVMQRYRCIQAAHGIVPGPHAGRPVSLIAAQLQQFGATIV